MNHKLNNVAPVKKRSKLPYAEQLNTPEWATKRLLILKRDNYKCASCGSKAHLQVHHKKYYNDRMAWEVPDSFLETLCRTCHVEIHKANPIQTFFTKKKKPGKPAPASKQQKEVNRINRMKETLSKKDKDIQSRYDKINAA